MSVRAMCWVLDESPARLADRLVLIALADEADDDGGACYPAQRRIAKRSRLGQTRTRRSIDRLEAAGEILVLRPDKPAPGRHSRYVITLGRDPVVLADALGWPEPRLDPSVAEEWALSRDSDEADEPVEPTALTGARFARVPRNSTAHTGAQSPDRDRAHVGAEPRQTAPHGGRGTAPNRAALQGADPLTPTSDPEKRIEETRARLDRDRVDAAEGLRDDPRHLELVREARGAIPANRNHDDDEASTA